MEHLKSIGHLRNALLEIGKLPDKDQKPLLAELGRKNLFYLATSILGFKDVDAKFHWELTQVWERPERSKLILCPRGTFKTSILTIAGTIQRIINQPDIRVLISNATLDNAKAILKGIKDQFIFNSRFRQLYPEFCPRTGDKKRTREFGTQEEFRIPNQTPGIRESTVEIGSVEGNLVSRHYELFIGDDLVNDKNTNTKEQIDKTEFFINAAFSLLEPNVGESVLIGTRWHFDDCYGRILDAHDRKGYFVYQRAIMESDKKGKMRSIFPKRFPPGELARIKKKQGSYLFHCQYMNDPLPEEDQVFKKSWIKYYDTLPPETMHRLWIVTSVDPAVSDAKRADRSALVTVGVDHNDDIYVLECINGRMDPSELIETIFAINSRWKPVKIGIETFSFQKALKYFIKDEMKRKKIYLPIHEFETDTTKSKEVRIRGLQPRIQHSNFYVRRDMDDLVDQMLRFPRAKHDDIIDALANSQQLFRTPYKRKVPDSLTGQRWIDMWRTHTRPPGMGKIGYERLASNG